MTDAQTTALEKASASALRLKHQADTARGLGLPILESYLREASVACQAGCDFQEAAFRKDLKAEAQAENLGFLPHEEAKREFLECNVCHVHFYTKEALHGHTCPANDVTRSPMIEGGERQADAIADAMKRKGYLSAKAESEALSKELKGKTIK